MRAAAAKAGNVKTDAPSRALMSAVIACVAGCGLLLGWHLAGRSAVVGAGPGCFARVAVDQKANIEKAYWDNMNFDIAALAKLPREELTASIVIADSDANRRKHLWDFYLPHYSCPQKEKVGTMAGDGDNGKWLCGVRSWLQRPGCVVYSVGSNGDVSFEQGILSRTKCEIHVFDPTMTEDQKAIVRAVPNVVFHDYGLGTKDAWVDLGTDTSQTKGRLVPKFETKTLDTIMKELGHDWVDVLKIDIEGAEWNILDHMLNQPKRLPFTQMQVEFHNMATPELVAMVMTTVGGSKGDQPLPLMRRVMAGMLDKDLRVFSTEPNVWWHNNGYDFMEYSYLQVDRQGNIIIGPPMSGATRQVKGRRLAQ